jgi:hypothetical protein
MYYVAIAELNALFHMQMLFDSYHNSMKQLLVSPILCIRPLRLREAISLALRLPFSFRTKPQGSAWFSFHVKTAATLQVDDLHL